MLGVGDLRQDAVRIFDSSRLPGERSGAERPGTCPQTRLAWDYLTENMRENRCGSEPRWHCKGTLQRQGARRPRGQEARQARSEEHTSELQLLMRIPYAVFCLKKK